MLSKPAARVAARAQRSSVQLLRTRPLSARIPIPATTITTTITPGTPASRPFSSSSIARSILPDAETPPARQSEPADNDVTANLRVPTELTPEQYHELADEYLEALQAKLEEKSDAGEGVEVEYSTSFCGQAGVLTIEIPGAGTYVLNKQPPNKQIWLSSPVTGPKRYDWLVVGEGMTQKEGAGLGEWVYLRDGSTLTDLLRKELGVDLSYEELEGEVLRRGEE
ncbi:arabinogalactan endo-1,4-beta-galactosidase [Phyllosticta citrichinensis]|uniref:ferroxidase n=1 Tax=Phyllosticta citrichinensis TaxID=1130410 RepID=A0ABR1Y0Z7_9PEZI